MSAAAVMIIIALWQKNILFGLFILLAEIMLVAFGRQAPVNKVYSLHVDGLFVDDQRVRLFSESSAFAFFDTGRRYVELVLRPSKKIHTYAKVLVPQERVEDVRKVLAKHLPPFEYNGTVSDAMARWLQL
jgi:hypothetical protein